MMVCSAGFEALAGASRALTGHAPDASPAKAKVKERQRAVVVQEFFALPVRLGDKFELAIIGCGLCPGMAPLTLP